MKIVMTFIFLIIFSSAYSQKKFKIKRIDALVSKINTSSLQSQRDTLIQDLPELGLKTITFLTMIMDGEKLIKYENLVNATFIEKGVERKITSSNIFYFGDNKLIKVEEYLIENGKKKTDEWYYSKDKPLYYTLQSDKAEDRANLLLKISKELLSKIIK